MNLSSFAVEIDDDVYQAAANRARQAGKTLDQALTELLTEYAEAGSGRQDQTYTVQRGDTLSKIALDFYGDAHKYPVIQKANNLADPNRIWVGQVLVIPALSDDQPASPAPTPTSPPAPQPTPQPSPTPQPTPTPPPPAPTPQPTPTPHPPAPSAPPTVADYVRAMPAGLRRDRAGGVNVVYQFRIAGSGTWTVSVANQKAAVTQGQTASPSVAISLSGSDFIRLAQGQLNTVQAYQQGRVQVNGDLHQAARLTDLFAPWAGNVSGTPLPTPQPTPTPEPAPTPQPTPTPTPGGTVNPQLLNGSFDDYQPFVYEGDPKVWKEDRFPEEYGSHWELDILDVGKSRFHMMNSGVFGTFTQKYFGGSGLDYHQHGRYSQVVTSRYRFDIVLRQTVAAQPGRDYTFNGMIVSFYKGTGGEQRDGVIFKSIGIDPTGGTQWDSPNVVWGERDGKDNAWRYPKITAKSQGNAITVFIRLENTKKDVGKTELNIVHLEKFELK